MAPLKRTMARPANDESDLESEESGRDFNESSSYARKRRRTSNDPAARGVDETDQHVNHDGVQTPEPSESEDEAEYEMMATQALRERKDAERGNKAAESGILETVQVINFMCHVNTEVVLGPLINFVCGRNGSGKSAVLTAITLCLGGKASATNRGQSLKSFIKEGKDMATVIVRIKNQGDGAYMADEYGTSIVVERWFNRAGASGFRLKSEKGRIISTKKMELEEICDHFALQMDNPMNVLSQDMARQFIGTSTAADKYKLFVKGVQLEQLDQDYRIIEENLDNIEAKLEARKPDVKFLEGKMEKAKNRLALSDRHNVIRDKQRHYRRQWAWAQVETQERIRDEYTAELTNADEKIASAERDIDPLDNAFQSADRASTEAAEAHQRAQAEAARVQTQKSEVKEKYDEIKRELTDAQGEKRSIRETLQQNERTMTAKREEIEEETRRLAELDGGGAAARLVRLEEAKEAAKEARNTLIMNEEDKGRLDKNLHDAEVKTREQEQHLRPKMDEIDRRKNDIDNLSRNRSQQDTAFHQQMPALLNAIQNERSFTEQPVGPVGKHVRLLKPEWSSILEKSFGATLSSFIVTSKRDMNILNAIMNRVGCFCPIIIGNNQPIDTTSHEPDADFDTTLRVLDIDNDLVRKQLIIQHNVEQTVLIADMNKASEVLYSGPRPRNVKRCYSVDPHNKRRGFMLSFTRRGEASQDPIHEFVARARMRTDIEAQIRLRQEALLEARQDLNRLESQLRMARDTCERAKQTVVRHKRTYAELKIASQRADDKIEEVSEAIRQDSIEGGKLQVLQSALHEAEEAKALYEGSYQEAIIAFDAKKDQLNVARENLNSLDEQIASLQAVSTIAETEAQKLSKKRAVALGEKNAAIGRIDDAKQDRASLQRKSQEHEARVLEFTAQAGLISPRVNVDEGETEESLKKKYQKLTADVNKYQQQIGATREEIAAEATRTEEAYSHARQQIEDLENLAWTLKSSLMERRERWVKFRSFISCRAKAQFTFLLSERSFRGKLITDHKQKLLELSVEPDITKRDASGRGAKTLSGGEKSFSQICLLLSIWEAMGSPIRCLDEFDVYMDAVNRKMSIDLIVGAARQSVGKQFVLITPGSRSDFKKEPDVNPFEMPEPERGPTVQTRLPY